LNAGSRGYDFLESGLGVKVARDFRSDQGTYIPEIHIKWLRELNNPAVQDSASFSYAGSGVILAPGLKAAADTLDIGAGLTLLASERIWSFEAIYDYEWRSDHYSAQQGSLKFTYRFGGGATDVCDCVQHAVKIPPVVPVPSVPRSYLVFFDFDKSDLSPQAVAIVGQAARNAGPAEATEIEVTGNTDTMGSDAYNMRLSRRRAESVAAQLENDGIPASEIAITAKGKRDPLVPTGDGVREPQNRRVQIVYSTGRPAS
jgi:outer membrane protein OmpA-like peptidoglycan-associated protein